MLIEKIHHVAYRCKDAKETVDFYKRVMGMELVGAIAEDKVPSTKEPDPYMHIFLDAGSGNILAFFELPKSPPMSRDPNTPDWTQHIAFQVADVAALETIKAKAKAEGLEVVGPTDHDIFKSIYFFDPSGHRLELAAWTTTPETMAKLKAVAPAMVEEWAATKKPPRHAAWLHEKEFAAH
ncbi:VOC family protein [Pseudorhodoplanes sinuspersici]|uniref:Glyoxalase n=1 Tax=Pseudorhodoplanes sinuspersici TaxID=1235591 RepID=A0A1W7A0G8_9HYPH|nr:VOC family protein [Pseudorhodoplanes sinuspersici]ARQ03080.1 glyoxalase [Pseudorhodoplanes sinuspersici]RKE72822.1 glyoxylase I family protein [Pseudorhodoplanes sinuspersici]